MEQPFQDAVYIIEQLNHHGHAAYFVGGSVRDYDLGRTVKDVDIATSAEPEDVRAIFPTTIPVGIEHGTVIVRHNHRSYEVTTFRREADYDDYRHPSSVSFVSSLREDLQRRDFTMNAIALSKEGEWIDPFNGREHIKRRRIATVGRAEDRFREDPLRMMRAVRFVSQLSFQIEDHTLRALRDMAHYLRHISVERITAEFENMLAGENVNEALTVLVDSGLYQYLPGMSDKKQYLRQAAAMNFRPLRLLHERWALVCAVLQINQLTKWLKRWKLSNRSIDKIGRMKETAMTALKEDWTPLLLYNAGRDIAASAEKIRAILAGTPAAPRLQHIDLMYKELPIQQRKELAVNGRDLLNWCQKKPGPWVSKHLETIEKAVVNKEVENDRKAIQSWMQKQQSSTC